MPQELIQEKYKEKLAELKKKKVDANIPPTIMPPIPDRAISITATGINLPPTMVFSPISMIPSGMMPAAPMPASIPMPTPMPIPISAPAPLPIPSGIFPIPPNIPPVIPGNMPIIPAPMPTIATSMPIPPPPPSVLEASKPAAPNVENKPVAQVANVEMVYQEPISIVFCIGRLKK